MCFEEERNEFFRLLEDKCREQTYQSFMERHTRFIPRDFVQNHGIHLSLVLRKLSFGADYKTDFFFFSKSTVNWNAVFIEIEKPSSRFFKSSTNDFHSDFSRALQQINQWKAWFLNEQNKAGFLSMVSAIRVPHHMASNPTFNKYVLVVGRRAELDGNADRRRLVQANENDDFKIITFDSLAEGLAGKREVSIGSRHNHFIDILTDEMTDANLYSWVDPTQLRVSETLRDRLEKGPRSNHYVSGDNGERVESLSYAAPRVRVRHN